MAEGQHVYHYALERAELSSLRSPEGRLPIIQGRLHALFSVFEVRILEGSDTLTMHIKRDKCSERDIFVSCSYFQTRLSKHYATFSLGFMLYETNKIVLHDFCVNA